MNASLQRIGRVQSGDISIFYRHFGSASPASRTPLIIMHGSDYFDSYDWIDVASALGEDRQVVAFDHRGFGRSTWSPHKDYSLDTMFSDIINVSKHFGWEKPAIMGHGSSGRLGVFFAACMPKHLSQLIVGDTAMGKGTPGVYQISVANKPTIYKSVEDAMASLAKKTNPRRFSEDRERAARAMKKVKGGYVLTRDPDVANAQSTARGAPMPKYANLDSWEALGKVKCPVTFIKGERSDRNTPERYGRLARDFPKVRVESIDSRHDLAFEAPEALVAVVSRILIDPSVERSRRAPRQRSTSNPALAAKQENSASK